MKDKPKIVNQFSTTQNNQLLTVERAADVKETSKEFQSDNHVSCTSDGRQF